MVRQVEECWGHRGRKAVCWGRPWWSAANIVVGHQNQTHKPVTVLFLGNLIFHFCGGGCL